MPLFCRINVPLNEIFHLCSGYGVARHGVSNSGQYWAFYTRNRRHKGKAFFSTLIAVTNTYHSKTLFPLFEKVKSIPSEKGENTVRKEEDLTGKEAGEKEWDEITSIYYQTNEEIVGVGELQRTKSVLLLKDEPSCGGSLISLLSTLLEVNEELLADIEENGSWKILALLLHKIPPEAFDRKTIEALDRFASILFHYGTLLLPKLTRRRH